MKADVRGAKNPRYNGGYKTNLELQGLYNSWQNMKQRCFNKKHPKYPRYGGRGITVCDEWLDVRGFAEWAIANGWKKGYSIDRIDVDGDYCPQNCRWVTVSDNSRRKSTTKIDLVTAQEIRSRIDENWSDLAKEYGCSLGYIWFIMKNFTHVQEGECVKKIKQRQEKNCIRNVLRKTEAA